MIRLRDTCPRCGWELPRGEGSDDAKEHLGACNDKEAIAKHQKFVARQKEEEERKKNANANQYEVMAMKRWEMNGRQVSSSQLNQLNQLITLNNFHSLSLSALLAHSTKT